MFLRVICVVQFWRVDTEADKKRGKIRLVEHIKSAFLKVTGIVQFRRVDTEAARRDRDEKEERVEGNK